MSEQWTTVTLKKKKKKTIDSGKAVASKKTYVPPVIRKAPKSYPKMKNPNLWKDIKNFKESELNQVTIPNLYLRGDLYNSEKRRLNNNFCSDLNNSKVNEVLVRFNKCLEMLNKFKRINVRNEDTASDLLHELKQLYTQFKTELQTIHIEDKFYQGMVCDNSGAPFYETDIKWEIEKQKYQTSVSQKTEQWKEILEQSKISSGKKFTDLFKN